MSGNTMHNTGTGLWTDSDTWDTQSVPTAADLVDLDAAGVNTVTLAGAASANEVQIVGQNTLALLNASLSPTLGIDVSSGGQLLFQKGFNRTSSILNQGGT